MSDGEALYETIKPIVEQARQAVLTVYQSGVFHTTEKSDHTPVTAADEASHHILVEGLQDIFHGVPTISEESRQADQAAHLSQFWLIDPLDGTKEFIRRSGEFTINVALLDSQGSPVWGLIDVPLTGRTYVGGLGASFYAEGNGKTPLPPLLPIPHHQPRRVTVSRSHRGQTDEWLAQRGIPIQEVIYAGSAVKFCWVQEGRADLYVRLMPTMGWDTAAGQALVEAVGGTVCSVDGSRLTYHPWAEVNPGFVVSRPVFSAP